MSSDEIDGTVEGLNIPLVWRRGWTQEALELPSGPLPHLFAYWLSLRGGRDFPSRQDIDPEGMAPILRHIMLVEALPDGDWLYRVAGSHIVEGVGTEISRRRLRELGDALAADRLKRQFDAFRADPMPEYTLRSSPWRLRDWTIYSRLLLPVGVGGRLTHILGAIEFKEERSYGDL